MKKNTRWWMIAALALAPQACISASAVTNPALFGSWQRAQQNTSGDVQARDQTVTFGDDTTFRNHELSQRSQSAATNPGCVVDSDFEGTYLVNGEAIAITYSRATVVRSNCINARENGTSNASDTDISRYNDSEFGTGRSYVVRGDELTLSSPNGESVYRRVRPPTPNAAQVTGSPAAVANSNAAVVSASQKRRRH